MLLQAPRRRKRWNAEPKTWIAFDSSQAGNSDIYIISADGSPSRRLTTGSSNNIRPSWSTDGRWIYFGSNRSGDWQIWKAPAQGGSAVQVTKKQGGVEALESADGGFVFYARLNAPGIWKVPVKGGEESKVLEQGGHGLWALTGQSIAFFDLDYAAGPSLNMYSLATGKTTCLRQFSKETQIGRGDTAMIVSADGRWILYTRYDQSGSDLMLVENFH